jgi:alpha-glucosidase
VNRLFLPILLVPGLLSLAPAVELKSPDGHLVATIETDSAQDLVYTISRDGKVLLAPSRIGVTIEGVDLGKGTTLGQEKRASFDDQYPVFGPKSIARNRANTLALSIRHDASGQSCTLEARAFDDGFAWRIISPGSGSRTVLGEASSWVLPEKSIIWFGERNSPWKLRTYAGEFVSAPLSKLPTVSSQGPVQCPPLLAELPDGLGYILVTEAALENYSGLRLRAIGESTLQADLADGLKGFPITGDLVTPWRVTILARDLDGLVNTDIISALNPPPDARLFRDLSYIKPGRSVWRWWSKGTGSPDEERAMIDDAAALGFEYSLVDDGWAKWPDAWKRIRELATHGSSRKVGLLIWKDSNEISNPAGDYAAMRSFLDSAKSAGVAGVKVDFFNSESQASIAFQRRLLVLAAERKLLVILHGIQKPTGESRTFPNEITREGVRGLELNHMTEGMIPASHNAALPFIRYVVGPGDYTPLGYSTPGDTTWAHQLTTVITTGSPLMVIAENPAMLLRDPAVRPALDVLKAIPTTWDETRVLPQSRIGELAILARRKGSDWFLAILAGDRPASLANLDLSFLGHSSYQAVMITSPSQKALERKEWQTGADTSPLPAQLASNDGLVIWFRKL